MSLFQIATRRSATAILSAILSFGVALPSLAATFITFDPGNGNGTYPYDINAQGVVSGVYQSGVDVIAFLRAQDGTITTFTVPSAQQTYPVSINSSGTVAGSYRFADNKDHGFIRSPDGSITTFDVPKAVETTVSDMNESGVVTGYANGGTRGIGFVRAPDGSITRFQVPGQTDGSYPRSINFEGEITGDYCCTVNGSESVAPGFLRHANGTFTKFLAPNAKGTLPLSIIPSHVIAGFYMDPSDNYHGFFRSNGSITTFDIAGGTQTQTTAMNINEVITGLYYDGSADRGFLFHAPTGGVTTFDVPNSKSTFPEAINREGQVTGSYYPSNGGNPKGFVRIP